ncbi:MAG: S1 RNA-binding domain-containing protein, partial [Phycisphaerae bacterium]
MPDPTLLEQITSVRDEVDREMDQMFAGGFDEADMAKSISPLLESSKPNPILSGTIVGVAGNDVLVDVGMKSEGYVPVGEWDDPSEIKPGNKVDVLLESVEGESGNVMLSKRKADRIHGWNRILNDCNEGDRVTGRVTRKIKGGLLVDIGVPVFLPASQIDIRRPADVGEYLGRSIDAVVLKIDTERRNIVISRRKLIEDERNAAKTKLMAELQVGDFREGVVKNIADFGAFVDLGGIDGLLHITDMSWDRIGHP